MIVDVKNKVLSYVEEVIKIVEMQVEKVEVFFFELSQLKVLVGVEEQKKVIEGDEVVFKLKFEIEMLKGDFENVGILQNKLKD